MFPPFWLSFSKHSAVIAAFGLHLIKSGIVPAEFHRYLTEGQSARSVSDYDIGPEVTPDEASEQIARAQEFVEVAAHLVGSLHGQGR